MLNRRPHANTETWARQFGRARWAHPHGYAPLQNRSLRFLVFLLRDGYSFWPCSSSWKSVSCRPAGPASRELSEFHGVSVGGAINSAPAVVSLSVVKAESVTSNATRICGETGRPTSTASIISTCA